MALLISWRPSSASNISFPFIVKKTSYSKSAKMGSFSTNNISCSVTSSSASTMVAQRKLPVLLFDVMDTIVRDPFYHDVPAFFRMSMKELLVSKHPTSWIEFEKGLISEEELTKKFFKDGRSFDMEGLKNCMRRGYSYLEGVEGLLNSLKENGYEIHAFTNYPIWYQMIEDELKLSNYLSWTFCSYIFGLTVYFTPVGGAVLSLALLTRDALCTRLSFNISLLMWLAPSSFFDNGKRKPDPDFYLEVVKRLNVKASNCIFVDDRMGNVEAAIELGLKGLQFKNADLLRKDLSLLGVDISTNESQDLIECSS